jgi:drug/metabolite transporter (DMT)-like permease
LNKNLNNWLLFILLSFVWGSSFILMKLGMEQFSAYEVAALRICLSGIVLLPVAIRSFSAIPTGKLWYIFFSGLLGSLFPAFLFCIAETKISSPLAGTLNALTPIFVIIIGGLFFGARPNAAKIVGILIAFTGTVLLMFTREVEGEQPFGYMLCVIAATMMYGINVNMVTRHLKAIGSIEIAAIALALVALPALVVLFFTGFFQYRFTNEAVLRSLGATALLGVVGTAIATILYYRLMKLTGPVFSSMVTYGIPVVAVFWGVVFREPVGWKQVACLVLILAGVFIANIEMIVSATRTRLNRL